MVMNVLGRGLAAAAAGLLAVGTVVGLAGSAGASVTPDGTAGDGTAVGVLYEIQNRNSWKCVNVAHGSHDSGAWVQQYRCDQTAASRFIFYRENIDQPGEIRNLGSHLCLDVEGLGAYNGARTKQYTCTGSPTQQWQVRPVVAGDWNTQVRLVNVFSGRCLDVPNGTFDDWVVLNVWDCIDYAAGQQFDLNWVNLFPSRQADDSAPGGPPRALPERYR